MFTFPKNLQRPCAILLAALALLPQFVCAQDEAASSAPLAATIEIPPPESPAEAPLAEAPTPLQARLEQMYFDEEHRLGSEAVYAAGQLMDLYRENAFQPLWTDPAKIEELHRAVLAAADDGLNPADYHLAAIQSALGPDEAAAANTPPQAVAFVPAPVQIGSTAKAALSAEQLDRDILFSDALLLLGEHLLHGKVDGQDVEEKKGLAAGLPDVDINFYLQALRSGKIVAAMQSCTPKNAHYQALRTALVLYNHRAKPGALSHVPEGPALRPGMRDNRVLALKKRLSESGDLDMADSGEDLYDEALTAAVRQFQSKNKLRADGVAGRGTIAALNNPSAPSKKHIQQIRANLERTRWLMHDQPDSAVLVDIVGYQLHYYEKGKPVWSTRVMVGKPYTQTPSFRSAINYLVLNPTWTVPPGMMKREYLPKILNDPGYLSSTGLKVYDTKGNQVNPATINWSRYLKRPCPYVLRQAAGKRNSLGRLKFLFPNPYHVYLHDTPSKNLFDRQGRALSHGCIRVASPVELARRILEGDSENTVTVKQFDKLLASGKTGGIRLKNPLPVFLLYATAKSDGKGNIIFTPDIYGRDAAVIAALDQPPRPLAQRPPAPEQPVEAVESALTADKPENGQSQPEHGVVRPASPAGPVDSPAGAAQAARRNMPAERT